MARFNCGVKPATLVAISWPLEVARSCIWFPRPAARDSGIETSCCVPLPVETGMSRCWMGIVDGVCNPAWLVIRNCWATCGWPSNCWWLFASWEENKPVICKKLRINVNVTDTILWQGHHDRVMQLNWLYFCGICQMMPLKVWPNTALGCNHQSICMPQLQPLCSAALDKWAIQKTRFSQEANIRLICEKMRNEITPVHVTAISCQQKQLMSSGMKQNMLAQ